MAAAPKKIVLAYSGGLDTSVILTWLKDEPGQAYDFLRDVTAVDYGAGTPLQVVYQIFSLGHKRALSVKCELPLDDLQISSVFSLWKSANWLEREVFDLFGITFLLQIAAQLWLRRLKKKMAVAS